MPQGSVLGPVLFLIFINDLPDNIRSSVRLFAYDCVLYRIIYSRQDCLTLQEDLTSLGQWEADWQMKFNVAKCHSMRVTRHQHHKQILFDYSLHNQTLENVQSAKYLGITITDNMDWGQHVSEISSKATKTLGFLRRNLAFAPRSTKEVAYKTLVQPKLEYAAPIWSPHSKLQINQIEKFQRTAARWTCRRWRNTSSVGEMVNELEWPSLEAQRDRAVAAYLKVVRRKKPSRGEHERGIIPLLVRGVWVWGASPEKFLCASMCVFNGVFMHLGPDFSRLSQRYFLSREKPNAGQKCFQTVTCCFFFTNFSSACFFDIISYMSSQVLAKYF